MSRKIRYGMVGGGRGAFIGAVHRIAAAMDQQVELVCGAFSSDPERSKASGADLFLPANRCYGTFEEMILAEKALPADQRMDFIAIVTPNHMHFPPAKMALDNGFHVLSDKPATFDLAEAKALAALVKKTGLLYGLTHNYTGYPMVQQAREMVRAGAIGAVRKVIVEYHQGWLATQLEGGSNKQADWRTDPARSGIAGAIGDIGSHAENLCASVTGLEIDSLCADLTSFVPGRRLDDDGNLLLRFTNGARGVLIASQIETGCENDIRLRVFGERGMLDWRQEDPNHLVHAPIDGPRSILTRGSPWLCEAARRACRLPAGHPEAFIEAFANLYGGVASDIRARIATGVPASAEQADYPRIEDGARGVRFIEKTVASSASDRKWTPMR